MTVYRLNDDERAHIADCAGNVIAVGFESLGSALLGGYGKLADHQVIGLVFYDNGSMAVDLENGLRVVIDVRVIEKTTTNEYP